MSRPQVYVSGPLTGVPNVLVLKKFYEKIAQICLDLKMTAYLPHLKSDPIKHANIPPEDVYKMDSHQVIIADLIIAYIGVPSLGVGAELEIAHYNNIPIILLYEAGDKPVSRMARGNPAVINQIVFIDFDDAIIKLEIALRDFKKAMRHP